MYYCKNCRQYFHEPRRIYVPFPDYGGEWTEVCPYCWLAGRFEEV